MKEDLRVLKWTYAQYLENGEKKMYDLVEVLQTCENLITGKDAVGKKSVNIDGKNFEFYEPDNLKDSQVGVSPQEIEVAKKVL